MDIGALPMGDEDLVLAHPSVEITQTPRDTCAHKCFFAVRAVEETQVIGALEGGSQV